MDWLKPDSLATVGGAVTAVTILVAVLKFMFPDVQGRITQLCALLLSLIISGVTGSWDTVMDVLLVFLNGMVIFSGALGLDQMINYRRGE